MLLEIIVTITLLSIVLTALGGFTLRSITATNELRLRQAAVQIATSTTQTIDSLQASDLMSGRGSLSVSTQYSNASSAVQPYLSTMSQAWDQSNTSVYDTSSVTVPTAVQTRTLSNTVYSTTTYLGTCLVPRATLSSASCTTTSGLNDVQYVRAVVAVTWPDRNCTNAVCTYVTSTMVNADSDPVFSTTAVPVAAAVITNPGAQVSTVGSTVSLQLAATGGAAPLTWSISGGTLPTGLGMDSTGLVSGTPSAVTAATSVTIKVTDAFNRSSSASFTWQVTAAPTISTPGTRTSSVGTATTFTPTYTCPNTPCTFALSGAPAGLAINAGTGVISGTPTTAGTSSAVVITITDASNISASTSAFTWKVVAKPTITDPGTLNVTVGQTPAVAFTISCPTTTCTVALSNTIIGLGLATAAATTNNATTSLSVSSSTTTVYVTGKVQSSAVTSTSKSYSPYLTITDTNSNTATSATGTWTAYAAPTMGTLAAKTTTVKATPNVGLAWTCPISSCTITLSGTVPGVGLSTMAGVTTANTTTSVAVTGSSGTIYYTGLVSTSAVTSGTSTAYTPTITIIDADSVAASTSATWTITNGPMLTNPGTVAVEPSQSFAIQMSTTCPNSGCTWTAAYATSGSSTYTNLAISSTGKISASASAGTYSIKVTVTDSAGLTDTVTFTLKSAAFSITVPNQTSTKPTSGTTTETLDASALITPTADSYTYSLSGAPSWLTINADTGVMTASITSSSTSDTSIKVIVTSTVSSTSTVTSSSFSWTLK